MAITICTASNDVFYVCSVCAVKSIAAVVILNFIELSEFIGLCIISNISWTCKLIKDWNRTQWIVKMWFEFMDIQMA